ncbi:MAG TPA: UDP-N-acetylglucosamine 4,6-dehydratase (inverting) [Acidobacteriota bacterium]|nr:UDP-N-acetylglucosamine 4,6-dehydratase (inverting) [Acidobacteriota bacterium]
MNSPLQNRTILVTGGTGSFARHFIRKVFSEGHRPRKLIVFSRDEWKQWEMRRSDPLFDHSSIRYFLGDVRDSDRLKRAFRQVDLVVHAAAMKQVPASEYNPTEAIKTNIHGAINVIDAAIDRGVRKVVALSTDKAANPVNLYGATKLCSDKLFVSGNAYVGSSGIPRFSVVRYGNVLGSRGSIVPRWQQIVAEGARSLTVTDRRMTRFWITLDQAADFVIQTFDRMLGGEIFVPKIPSMKIVDLARAIAPDLAIHFTGIRPGEKLHELMIGEDDARHSLEFESYYAIAPELVFTVNQASYERLAEGGGKPLPEGFKYSSDSNSRWLDAEGLRELLREPSAAQGGHLTSSGQVEEASAGYSPI